MLNKTVSLVINLYRRRPSFFFILNDIQDIMLMKLECLNVKRVLVASTVLWALNFLSLALVGPIALKETT